MILFFQVPGETMMNFTSALAMIFLTVICKVGSTRLQRSFQGLSMGILLGIMFFSGAGIAVFMSYVAIAAVFFNPLNLLLIPAGLAGVLSQKEFLLEGPERMKLLWGAMLALIGINLVYAVIKTASCTAQSRKAMAEKREEERRKLEDFLKEQPQKIQVLEQQVDVLFQDEPQVLLEYKTLRLMWLWFSTYRSASYKRKLAEYKVIEKEFRLAAGR